MEIKFINVANGKNAKTGKLYYNKVRVVDKAQVVGDSFYDHEMQEDSIITKVEDLKSFDNLNDLEWLDLENGSHIQVVIIS